MQPSDVKTAADAIKIIEERNLTHIKVGVFDIDGILRGKYMSKEKFVSSLKNGFGFCDVVVGWDSNDQLYDNTKITGWHSGYPDAQIRIIPSSCREIPWEADTLFFLCEFAEAHEAVCPRAVLRRVLARAEKMGFKVYAGCEYEFFVFEETPDSVRQKRYTDLKPLTPGYFGYSVLRNSTHAEFYHGMLAMGEAMRMNIEGLHTETGPGVLEAALSVSDGLEAGDRAALFKTFAKVFAQRHDLMATFMAKWSMNWPGQSGHIHVSLRDKANKTVFFDAKQPHRMSKAMRHFIGGQQKLMPEILGMVASSVNSYTRLIPGFWAPTEATIGVENRTTALRIIPGSEKSQRVEYRVAAADSNPYIALAAAIGSGLWGIANKIEPEPIVEGNAYAQKFPARLALPRTLWDAAQNLKKSKAARELFGDEFVDHFAATREWEEREFRRHVTDWELSRYFEII